MGLHGKLMWGSGPNLFVHQRHEAEAMYGECDLVVWSLSRSLFNLRDLYASAGGDICLRPHETYIAANSEQMSPCRDWREPDVQFVDATGANVGPLHTLAARVARGYRVVALDEGPATPTVHSWTIDPENEWATGKVWVCNATAEKVLFEIYDPDISGTLLDSIELLTGEAGYIDVSGSVDMTPRYYASYDDAGTWVYRRTGTLFINTVLSVPQPIAVAYKYDSGSARFDLERFYHMPWPHATGG